MNNITKQSFLEKKSMSQDLATLIKQQILNGELNPGDRIVETKVAKELGISQTPVREAVRLLSGEGIINIVPNRGPIVKDMEEKDIFEIYSLRASLEGLAMRLTTLNATKEQLQLLVQLYAEMGEKLKDPEVDSLLKESLNLHQSIIQFSRHSRLIQIYDSISFQIELANRIIGMKSTKQKEYDEHKELIDALQKGDPDEAEKVMRRHIHRSFKECIQTLQNNGSADRTSILELWPEEKMDI